MYFVRLFAYLIMATALIEPFPPDPNISARPREDFPSLSNANIAKRSNQMNVYRQKPFTRYLEIDFGEVDRRDLNPFAVQNEIETKTGMRPKQITGSTKSKLTLQTKSSDQTEKCLTLTSLVGKNCKITPHYKFNQSRGLIFLKQCEIENMEEFRNHLKDQHDVQSVERATFIKSRTGATAYIITFNMEATPYTIYIPGEITDTVVNQFISRPMMCKKCLEYGHTMKRCQKQTTRCKRCSETDHEDKDCPSQNLKCYHCSESHLTGSKECTKQIQEQKILDTVEREKVTFQRARQILNEKPVTRTTTVKPQVFPTLFDITLPKGTKRKINPWLVEKTIQQHTGKMPRKCRGKPNDEDTFVVEIGSDEEARQMSSLTKIGNYDVQVTVNNTSNLQKGIIFIDGYDLSDFDGYREAMMKEHRLTNVEQAHWIKTRSPYTNALILTFQQEMPPYLSIPGETKLTFIQEHKRMPNLCKQCLEYGHPQRVCRGDRKCINCSSVNHTSPSCNEETKCLHCPISHRTGDRNCQQYKMEEEILAIQAKSQVSRSQAIVILDRERPNIRSMNFSAVAAAPAPTPPSRTFTIPSPPPQAAKPPSTPKTIKEMPNQTSGSHQKLSTESDNDESELDLQDYQNQIKHTPTSSRGNKSSENKSEKKGTRKRTHSSQSSDQRSGDDQKPGKPSSVGRHSKKGKNK